MTDVNDPQLISLGLGGVLLVFAFRTFWRTDGSWQNVVAAARQDAADARSDAAAARTDAAAARAAENNCRERLEAVESRLRITEARLRALETNTPPNGGPVT